MSVPREPKVISHSQATEMLNQIRSRKVWEMLPMLKEQIPAGLAGSFTLGTDGCESKCPPPWREFGAALWLTAPSLTLSLYPMSGFSGWWRGVVFLLALLLRHSPVIHITRDSRDWNPIVQGAVHAHSKRQSLF